MFTGLSHLLFKRALSFLTTPSFVSPGQTYSITWAGSGADSITINLLQSSEGNLIVENVLAGII